MDHRILYQPAYSLAVLKLAGGESIQAEAGAMVSMSADIAIETAMKGGLMGALKRTVLGGESLFFNTFTAGKAGGEITLAPTLPGDIAVHALAGETLFIQSGSYLASPREIALDTKWGGARSFFGSEGLFLLKAAGSGPVVLSSYGAIHPVDLAGGANYIVDTAHVVAFTQGVTFSVRPIGGMKSTFLSGEGLVCEFSGTGRVYLQTRSTQSFVNWLIPKLPRRSE
jgi:uncharacterized protein (TIGR00266 family)